jgi:hypothetical protein
MSSFKVSKLKYQIEILRCNSMTLLSKANSMTGATHFKIIDCFEATTLLLQRQYDN